MERTFVLIKPDGLSKKVVGSIVSRFEAVGLSVIAVQLVAPSAEMVLEHYPATEEWLNLVGRKTLDSYKESGCDANAVLGTNDPVRIGEKVRSWLVDYIAEKNCLAMVWEGNNAVANVRKLCGATIPTMAAAGTIRGDYSTDSPESANAEQRAINNLVHASGALDEAEREITLWFPELMK